jgi:hypothetical protein
MPNPQPDIGSAEVIAACCTPGTAFTASTRLSMYVVTRGPSTSRSIESGTYIVTMFVESKPGLTSISLLKLRISSPAPTSSTKASATSATTSP